MDVFRLDAGADESSTLELLREVTGLGRVEAMGLLANLPRLALKGLERGGEGASPPVRGGGSDGGLALTKRRGGFRGKPPLRL